MKDSREQSITGRVQKTKRVSVTDNRNLVVELNKQNGGRCLVDLGAVGDLSDLNIEQDDRISIQGPTIKVGDRRILLAQQLTMNGETQQISRSTSQFKGTIVDSRTATVQGQDHQMVVLDVNNKNRLVDLGPGSALSDLDLQEDEQITVFGPKVKVQDRVVVLAQRIKQGDQILQVSRPGKQDRNSQNAATDGRSSRRQRTSS